ncbi:glycosyltransferase [Dendronalium sp. ChiSLP03b]|uniref:glycosyltransferase family 4 protein n=1 Tax=Dendronalium sp. ChiSLP03b TaxID=3075381 RepID=UPI002AD21D8B|nr:glycosyltransferase [Dendronalium sp. ChiSLP03b]MDZ8208339.1 glycosyltransferase [Dendronalium sp. ChiSLP03b]
MKQVAIVVQRNHESIVGGSEALAWQYANLLSDEFKVDIITTTALNYTNWANELPQGSETKQGINIHRFPVTIGRSDYWHNLYQRLLREFHKPKYSQIENSQIIPWSIALQEEFIRRQGPYSQPLLSFLKQRWSDYQSIIFTTYLYPTTYFGIPQVPPSKVLLVPTLHDEPTAYLTAYKYMACKARFLIWLTNAEKLLGEELWGELPGRVVSMGVETTPYSPFQTNYPYILYSGRIDSSKGCNELINFFIEFKKDISSNLRLILTGKNEIEIPNHPDIDFKGFVSPEEKFQLMAGASIFVMPSPYESFSIVTLEAMAQCTPVLVNASCQVLVEHIERSSGGKMYHNYEEFSIAIQDMMADRNKLAAMGNLAREYVVSNYAFDSVKNNLTEVIKLCL